jgi:GDPmannose 4,6-dehydratase
LKLGDLDARRDWGFAGDYVRSMHLMLQQAEPRDYVIGTGITHTVREFVSAAFEHVGLDWRDYVVTSQSPSVAASGTLRADTTMASERLRWQATVTFNQLVGMMMESDLDGWSARDTRGA